jgi:DNA-binding response OmpR family regulator
VHALLRRAGKASSPGGTPAEVHRFGDVEVDVAARVVRRAGAEVALSPKTFDLLLALLRRRGRVVTRLDLMREVWGYGDDVVTRTLDTHVRELRRVLEADPGEPAHIRTVWRVGYRLDG